MDYKAAAKNFVENETEFHHAHIPTEQSNPKTRTLSGTIAEDTAAGVSMLLSVDEAIPPVAREAIRTEEFSRMITEIRRIIADGHKICFSGCGASGRLSVQMDATWRAFWRRVARLLPESADRWEAIRNQSRSIITGGDRALIKSVENYEDYISFGRRQTNDLEIGPDDLFITNGECGMPPSSAGTTLQADENGATTFFVYCNPRDVLKQNLERSRQIFSREKIFFLETFVGPMGVAGSTRMQVTTVELLVVGMALEIACVGWLKDNLSEADFARVGVTALSPEEYIDHYERTIAELRRGPALEGLSRMVDLEAQTYRAQGLVTYITHEYLLDIFTDTTERTPTFSLPAFRMFDDTTSQISWAYAKDPLYPSDEAWRELLGREPGGLDWTKEEYEEMGAAQSIIDNPPPIQPGACYRFNIGNDDDPSRYSRHPAVLVLIDVSGSGSGAVTEWAERYGSRFDERYTLSIGTAATASEDETVIRIPVDLPKTAMDLPTHLLVKVAFNVFSTATMAKIGRVWGNWMYQVEPTNKKLIDRSIRIISSLGEVPYEQAAEEFFQTYFHSPVERAKRTESFVIETLRRMGKTPE